MGRVWVVVSLLVGSLLGGTFVSGASAATVSYIAGDSLWLSKPDGSVKKKLSGPAGDGRVWTEQAQSDNGKIVAVRREPGKIAQLNSFTLFGPTGAKLQEGSLTHEPGWTNYAYPVSLDLTDNGVAVYGFSNYNPTFPVWTFGRGTYVRTVEKPFVLQPLKITDWEWPTLYHDRLVATQGQQVWLQDPGDGTPFAPDPDVGFLLLPDEVTINRTDVAANGKLFGIELNYDSIELYPLSHVPDSSSGPATVQPGGCVLPTQGEASHITISQDGRDIAWEDDRGVVSAGAPDFQGADPCNLTRDPVVLAADGKYPSIGAASLPTGGGGGGGGGGGSLAPVPSVPARITAASLKKGIWITVRVWKAGKVVLTGKIGRKVVARGGAAAKKAVKVRVRLRAVKAYRKKPRRLKGKTLVLRISFAGRNKVVRRVLK